MLLTTNERRVLRLLATSRGKDYSINALAKACTITPNGMYKILTKLGKEGVLKVKPIANIKSYRLNFDNEKTARVLGLAFVSETGEGRIRAREQDLQPLKKVTGACILFGSYCTTKRMPADLDVLFVLEKKRFEAYTPALAKAQETAPVKIHDIIQTGADMVKNLIRNDPIITEAVRNGIVLWGTQVLVEVIERASRQAEEML